MDTGNDTFYTLSSPYSLNDGVWHLITVSFSQSRLRMYIDGVSIGSVAITGILNTSRTCLTIGTSLYQGALADLASELSLIGTLSVLTAIPTTPPRPPIPATKKRHNTRPHRSMASR